MSDVSKHSGSSPCSTDSDFVKSAVMHVMAGLLANPNLIQHDAGCGWRLCNSTPLTLGEYAWHVARELERARTIP